MRPRPASRRGQFCVDLRNAGSRVASDASSRPLIDKKTRSHQWLEHAAHSRAATNLAEGATMAASRKWRIAGGVAKSVKIKPRCERYARGLECDALALVGMNPRRYSGALNGGSV